MKTVLLSGSLRENVGKKDTKKQRREGKVPCVLYGGKEQIHFVVDEKEFNKLIFTPEVYSIKLQIGDKEYTSILQDIQYHPVKDHVLHIDFLETFPDKPIKFGIPVRTTGISPGVVTGGILRLKLKKLIVQGLVKDMPEYIEIDISKLNIGDTFLVKDLKLENLTALHTANEAVALVKAQREVVVVEEEEEEGAEGATESEESAEGTEGATEE